MPDLKSPLYFADKFVCVDRRKIRRESWAMVKKYSISKVQINPILHSPWISSSPLCISCSTPLSQASGEQQPNPLFTFASVRATGRQEEKKKLKQAERKESWTTQSWWDLSPSPSPLPSFPPRGKIHGKRKRNSACFPLHPWLATLPKGWGRRQNSQS